MSRNKQIPKAAKPRLWQKTPNANLLRYVPCGTYFARIKAGGKLIRQSLKTDVLSVAQLRLADLEKHARASAASLTNAARGRMTFGDALQALLARMRAARPDEPPEARVLPLTECQVTMDTAARQVGMPRITHHDLRHLFATRCIEAGVDIPTVARWLGHQDGGALAMKVYGHLRDEHSAAMARRPPAHRPNVG